MCPRWNDCHKTTSGKANIITIAMEKTIEPIVELPALYNNLRNRLRFHPSKSMLDFITRTGFFIREEI